MAEYGTTALNAVEMGAGYAPTQIQLTVPATKIIINLHIVIIIMMTVDIIATMATGILRPRVTDLLIEVDTVTIHHRCAINQIDFKIAGKTVHDLGHLWHPGLHHHLIIHEMYSFVRPHQNNHLHKSPFLIPSVTSWTLTKICVVCK